MFGKEKVKPNLDNIEAVPKTKKHRTFGEAFGEIKESVTKEIKEKNGFEKKRNKYKGELNKAKEHVKLKDKEISKANIAIEKTKREIASLNRDLESYKKTAKNQDLVDRLELAKQKREGELKDLIAEKGEAIRDAEESKEYGSTSIKEAEEEIKSIEDDRRTKIEGKISQIRDKFGYDTLKETADSLKESIKEKNAIIKEKQGKLREHKEALSIARRYGFDPEFENLDNDCKEIEKEITSLQLGKEEIDKRLAEIQTRIEKINKRTAKWENLLISEGLNKKPTPEVIPMTSDGSRSDSGGFEDTSEKSPESQKESATNPKGASTEDGLKEILEGLAEVATGTNIAEGASSAASGGGFEASPTDSEEGKEKQEGFQERFNKAKSLEDIIAIVNTIMKDDELFETIDKESLKLSIEFINTSKSLENLQFIPKKYNLRSNIERLAKATPEKSEGDSTEAPPEKASEEPPENKTENKELENEKKFLDFNAKIDALAEEASEVNPWKSETGARIDVRSEEFKEANKKEDKLLGERDKKMLESREFLGTLSEESVEKMISEQLAKAGDVYGLNRIMNQIPSQYLPGINHDDLWSLIDSIDLSKIMAGKVSDKDINGVPEKFGLRASLKRILKIE